MKTKIVRGNDWVMMRGDCLAILEREQQISRCAVDHVITDPPYDDHVHAKSRRGGSGKNPLPDVAQQPCRISRAHDFGFNAITPAELAQAAFHFARIALRWTLVFSNVELAPDWRMALRNEGLDYVRTMAWIKERATPQFTGDRPAAGFETITLCHPKGKKKWNGGGKQGVYSAPVVQNNPAHRHERVHTAQKPLKLMMELVADFTNPGELVLDAYAGSATTGIACLRQGRRFLGIERDPKYFDLCCERLRAEEAQSTVEAKRLGQGALFG